MSLAISPPVTTTPRRLPVRRSSQAHLRLTLRGRLVIFMAVLVVALVGLTVGRLATSASASNSESGGTSTEVVVQPGETLWQIAEAAVPSADPRETVAVIMELNDLSTASVQAGQSLLVPVA